MFVLIGVESGQILVSLTRVLQQCGISSLVHTDPSTLVNHVATSKPDIVLLYRVTSEFAGEIIAQCQDRGLRMPVFSVLSKASALDRVLGLQKGISHCYTEPISYTRLIYDLGTVTYQAEPLQTTIGKFTVHPADKRIMYSSERLNLTPREFYLLAFLIQKRNQVVSRLEIWEAVWGMGTDYPTNNALDTLVYRLKQKLPQVQDWSIEAVYGIGYRFLLKSFE